METKIFERTDLLDKPLTRGTLMEMKRGEKLYFDLTDQRKVDTARAIASTTGKLAGCRFVVHADYDDNFIEITRGV